MTDMEERIAAAAREGEALLCALREKNAALGLEVEIPEFSAAKFTLEADAYDGGTTLMASFYPKKHFRAGVVLFHSDESCFAEYAVWQPHPKRQEWFVESVEGWIRDGEIKTDVKLAPKL